MCRRLFRTSRVSLTLVWAGQLCATYTAWLFTPAGMHPRSVFGSARFRSKNRLPVLSFLYKRKVCLCKPGFPSNRRPVPQYASHSPSRVMALPPHPLRRSAAVGGGRSSPVSNTPQPFTVVV